GGAEAEAAATPALLVLPAALVVAHRQRGELAAVDHEAHARFAGLAPELGVVGLHTPLQLRIERGVVGGRTEVRRGLEAEQVPRLRGDDRDRLDGGGAGADDPHALAGEVPALVRPAARVIRLAAEALPPRELRHLRRGQAARRHDAEARRHAV